MRNSIRQLRRLLSVPSFYFFSCIFLIIHAVSSAGDLWPLDRPDGMPSIQSLEVMCGKDHMDVHLTFSQPFEGIVSSKGQHGDPRCVYVPPSTGQTFFSFRIAYARCGTKPDLHGQFYENTVVVQYDKDLLEVWDEAKRLRCEWFNDYEKTASKPPMVIADLDVIQLDFRGDNVDCWMEIQHGKGPWAPPVSGIVPLGSTLTLVVAINDYRGEFDMRVKSCVASDGAGHVIQLSDESGCVLRPKMISRFLKARGADERASVITYAFFHAFKFPDALSVHIKCKVEICRHGCLDHCQLQPDQLGDIGPDLLHYVNPLERKDDKVSSEEHMMPDPVEQHLPEEMLYEDVVHEEDDSEEGLSAVQMSLSAEKRPAQDGTPLQAGDEPEVDITAMPHKDVLPMPVLDKFPHGPRAFSDPMVASPRSLQSDFKSPASSSTAKDSSASPDVDAQKAKNVSKASAEPMAKRKRRSVVISDRKARSADVGVSGLYEVISEADLAFSPDSRAEAVTVFQGRIREEVVYGICMPVPGFSLLFVLVAVSAVVSALVAGSLLYRYQLQKEHLAERTLHSNGAIPMSTFSSWVGLKFLRMRNSAPPGSRGTEQNGKARESSLVLNGKTSGDPQQARE